MFGTNFKHLANLYVKTIRMNCYSLDLFSDDSTGRQGIIDLSIILYPKLPEDDNDHVCCPIFV